MATAIAPASSTPSNSDDFGTVKLLTALSLTGLMVTLLAGSFGLDTSWAFF